VIAEKQSIEVRVNEVLNQLRPFLEADGGDMELVEVTNDGVALIKFIGACGSCNMSNMTLKFGLEEAVKKAVPEIKELKSC
jgi:Fe-S cluster biogenesis protein NfuA